ncbi:hypothetical protein EI42_05006 [Thermosporothrix hazakensis]|uniref:HTH cro/C1-type domain-containing protein n=2 Tax=Thermosporothrix TaxID=768650 RepID=A0A326U0Z3_THEHA|nr:hypothetical protein [Thermosporothrix hazakensis]PZW23384.1 hypothetical protein EI42_05006 [Thermosporothrix hazakensis]BBH89729.1 hypothetical protein KTC_44800 [Thermosporothrix sp. COM3]GCE47918.1 hypothetical protein KTH_27870 [Thermosporothrix hazakensis]
MLLSQESSLSNKEIGKIIRAARIEKGWSVEIVAKLYGEALRGKSVDVNTIYCIEEGIVPKDMRRRAVLAEILNIPPMLLGLDLSVGALDETPPTNSKKISAKIVEKALLSYWEQGPKEPHRAMKDLANKIQSLHNNVLYTSSPEKEKMKKLLCACHIRRAYLANELGLSSVALDHLDKAILLAREEGLKDLEIISLYRKGEFYFDKWDLKKGTPLLQAALDGAKAAALPTSIKGRILVIYGLACARQATGQKDVQHSIKMIEQSEHFIDGGRLENGIYTLEHDRFFLFQNLGKGFVETPKLKSPRNAIEIADEMEKLSHPNRKRFYAYESLNMTLIRLQAYQAMGYQEIAIEMALQALQDMKKMHSFVHLPVLTRTYENAKETPYGRHSEEVAELGVQLLFCQYSGLFKK